MLVWRAVKGLPCRRRGNWQPFLRRMSSDTASSLVPTRSGRLRGYERSAAISSTLPSLCITAHIARPVRVYAVKIDSDASTNAPRAAAPATSGPPRLSTVVLPFANIGGDAAQDYLVDAITDSLTTDLSRTLALSQARETSQALASDVIVGSLPGCGRSSSAASGP
jgi:hypothetical protein